MLRSIFWSIAAGSATPVGSLSSAAVRAIAVTVAIVALLIVSILAAVLIFGCVHYYKNRQREAQFQFKSMSYSDVKEREARQDTEGEGTPPGTIDKKEDEAWFTEEKA